MRVEQVLLLACQYHRRRLRRRLRLVGHLGLRTGLYCEHVHGLEDEKKLGDVEKEPAEKRVLDGE